MFKIGGAKDIEDGCIFRLINCAPKLKHLDLNGLEKITDTVCNGIIKFLPNLEIILLNFTPNISQNGIDILKAKSNLKVIRHLNKMSDPNDDGLRMPLISVNKMKKPVKKKKKNNNLKDF